MSDGARVLDLTASTVQTAVGDAEDAEALFLGNAAVDFEALVEEAH
jgi:hypothetical protein